MNKRIYIILIICVLLLTLINVSVFAQDYNSESKKLTGLRKLSTEEIKKSALNKLKNDLKNIVLRQNKRKNITPYAGTFYVEWPVGYNDDYTIVDKEAFQIAEFTFDTYGHPEDYKKVTVTYTGGDTVTWVITGTIQGEAEFSVIKANLGISVSRESTISNSVQASATYYIKKDSIGVIPIYAYGYKTVGAMKYKWEDRYGNTGYIYKNIRSYLPYKKYTSSYIKFGRLIYE